MVILASEPDIMLKTAVKKILKNLKKFSFLNLLHKILLKPKTFDFSKKNRTCLNPKTIVAVKGIDAIFSVYILVKI